MYHLQRNDYHQLRIKSDVVDLGIMHRVCQHSGEDIYAVNPAGFSEIHKKLFRFVLLFFEKLSIGMTD